MDLRELRLYIVTHIAISCCKEANEEPRSWQDSILIAANLQGAEEAGFSAGVNHILIFIRRRERKATLQGLFGESRQLQRCESKQGRARKMRPRLWISPPFDAWRKGASIINDISWHVPPQIISRRFFKGHSSLIASPLIQLIHLLLQSSPD